MRHHRVKYVDRNRASCSDPLLDELSLVVVARFLRFEQFVLERFLARNLRYTLVLNFLSLVCLTSLVQSARLLLAHEALTHLHLLTSQLTRPYNVTILIQNISCICSSNPQQQSTNNNTH